MNDRSPEDNSVLILFPSNEFTVHVHLWVNTRNANTLEEKYTCFVVKFSGYLPNLVPKQFPGFFFPDCWLKNVIVIVCLLTMHLFSLKHS